MILAIAILLLLLMLAAIGIGLLCVAVFVAALMFDLTIMPAMYVGRRYSSRF